MNGKWQLVDHLLSAMDARLNVPNSSEYSTEKVKTKPRRRKNGVPRRNSVRKDNIAGWLNSTFRIWGYVRVKPIIKWHEQ